MLSSVTINCQVTKIVMNSDSQLSELYSVSQMSHVSRIALRRCSYVFVFVFVIVFVIFLGHIMSSHHSEQMSQRSQVSRIAL